MKHLTWQTWHLAGMMGYGVFFFETNIEDLVCLVV